MALNPTTVSTDETGNIQLKNPTLATSVTGVQYLVTFVGGILVGKGAMKAEDLSAFVGQIPNVVAAVAAAGAAIVGMWNTVRGIYKQIKAAQTAPEKVLLGTGDGTVTAADVPVKTSSPSK